MSRKSVAKRSSIRADPAIEISNTDDQRLDLDKIVDINPWKDMEKLDEQEAGQIQQVLVQFNDMLITDGKKNKRKSLGKNRGSVSPSQTMINDEKSSTNDDVANNGMERAIETNAVVSENEKSAKENAGDDRDNENDIVNETKESALRREKEKSTNPGEKKSIGKKRVSSVSSTKTNVSGIKIVEDRSVEKTRINAEKFQYLLLRSEDAGSNVVVAEKNICDDETMEVVEQGEKIVEQIIGQDDDEKIESPKEKRVVEENIVNNVNDRNVIVADCSVVRSGEIEKSVSPLASNENNGLRNIEVIELSSDDDDCSTNDRTRDDRSTNQSVERIVVDSAKIMVEQQYLKSEIIENIVSSTNDALLESNEYNRKIQSAKAHDVKIAKAFSKFSEKFVKYSSKMSHTKDHISGASDSSIDSESDSSSDDDSSSSSTDDTSRSSSDSSSCGCCRSSSSMDSSSSSSYTSCSDSTSSGACSCPCCCVDDEYSEYTVASSSSTRSGSEGSNESSTD